MRISSPAFDHGAAIPADHTDRGADLSPPLHLEGVPRNAQALALIMSERGAEGRDTIHWLLWNLSTEATDLPAGLPAGETVPGLTPAVQGTNDFGRVGYSGPSADGETGAREYRLRLLALDSLIHLNPGSDHARLEVAIADRIMAEAELVGTFIRD